MKHSEPWKELPAAFAAAQAEITSAKKTSENPHFKSRYADLSEVDAACRPALNKFGIGVVQAEVEGEPLSGAIRLETMLIHKSGEWMSGVLTVPFVGADPQRYGSALTYARRYGLAAITGVCPDDDDDDDGNAATGDGKGRANGQPRPAAKAQTRQAAKPKPEPLSPEENKKRIAEFDETMAAREFDVQALHDHFENSVLMLNWTEAFWVAAYKLIDSGQMDSYKLAAVA